MEQVEAPAEESVKVMPIGCPCQEDVWLANSKKTEEEEHERLRLLKTTNMTEFMEVRGAHSSASLRPRLHAESQALTRGVHCAPRLHTKRSALTTLA